MYKISKEFRFEAAHLLENHGGDCLNLHGHSYRLVVALSSESIQNGMILDYSLLKKVVEDALISKIDHSFIFNQKTTDVAEKEIAEVLERHGRKLFVMQGRATAENMAAHFFALLQPLLKAQNCRLHSLEVYETATSLAEFSD